MLSSLHIQNFAIVSTLLLECPAKMSAFTGETGAGKSIMIDALALLLGGRADASIIRPNCDKCELSAQFFYDPRSTVEAFLEQHELLGESGEIIVRRVMNKEGRSKFFINDHVSSAQQVKNLGHKLVHIHGQHEQQNLLVHATHRDQLDDYAQLHSQKAKVSQLYHEYQNLSTQLKHLEVQHASIEQLQLYEYQLLELTELSPQADEIDNLHKEQHQLHHAHQYLQHIAQAQTILDSDNEYSILKHLTQVMHILGMLPKDQPNIENALYLIDSAMIQIDETQSEIEQFAQSVQIDEERLAYVEKRMSDWHHLARKFQIDVQDLHHYQDVLEQQIASIKNLDAGKTQLRQACEQKKLEYINQAQILRQLRQQHAPELAHAIEQIIKELGMPHAKLVINIQALDDMHPHGMDRVEYLITTNAGSKPAPLAKIASGGELSRISLSIHLITAQRGLTPTLLFDEVDVGIGGATAMKVGQRLRELGEKLQIFCVTHQPQVASCAHQHFQVSKFTEDGQTFSAITHLEEAARIDEIARMLGGITISEQTRNNAKELLDTHK